MNAKYNAILSKALLALTVEGSRAIEEITKIPVYYCNQPMIHIEDFNVNFSLSESKSLLNFL